MVTLHYKKKILLLPENFEEISGKQFVLLSDLLYRGGDFMNCQVKALSILGRIGWLRLRLMDSEFIEKAREFINWAFDTEHLRKVTKQMIPIYKGFHGPESDFDNLRMGEFHFSEIFYKEIVTVETGSSDHSLNKLVAVLYRRAKRRYKRSLNPDGDIRKDFNAHEIEHYSKKVSRWPDSIKHAIFLWYDSCRHSLIDNNELVFKAPANSFESQFDTGLYGMMRSLAGEKLGSVEKIENMYVHTAMMEIGLIREEEKHIEELTTN